MYKRIITTPVHIHPCPHYGICSGCAIPFDDEKKEYDDVTSFFKEFGCSCPLIRGGQTGWRVRSKLAVRREGIGLFQEKSHITVPIPKCLVHHPSINEAVQCIQAAMHHMQPYDENSNSGDLKYLQFSVERLSKKVACAFHVNFSQDSPKKRAFIEWCEALFRGNSLWHSMALNFNPLPSNTIATSDWEHLFGPPFFIETLCGEQFSFSSAHFMQANLEMYEVALNDVVALVPQGAHLVELYGGAGIMGCLAASRASSVIVSDKERHAEASFRFATERLVLEKKKRLQYAVGDAATIFSKYPHADTLLVDPPRKGLSHELIQLIGGSGLSTIIYLSCSFASLKHNVEQLSLFGFKPTWSRAYDFFPGTEHIELLCSLKK